MATSWSFTVSFIIAHPLLEYEVEQVGTLTAPKFLGIVRVAGRTFRAEGYSPNVKGCISLLSDPLTLAEAQQLAAGVALEALGKEYPQLMRSPQIANYKGELMGLFRRIYRLDPTFKFHDDTGVSAHGTFLPRGYERLPSPFPCS